MPVIVTPKPSGPVRSKSAEPTEPEEEGEDESAPVESTIAATSTAVETAVAVDTSRRPGPLAGAMGREKYIGPGTATGKVPVVGAEVRGGERRKDGGGTGERARPAVKLAPMPKTRQPSPQTSAAEPPAQKPDLRLPADVLGAGKQGTKPLAAHLRRHERTLDEEKKQRGLKGLRPPGTPAPLPVPETEEERRGKGRHRRGKDAPADGEEGGPMLGGREQRQLARRRSPATSDSEDRPQRAFGRRQRRPVSTGANTAAPRKERISIQLPCTVRELSEEAGVPATEILRILMNEGVMTTITAVMDAEYDATRRCGAWHQRRVHACG